MTTIGSSVELADGCHRESLQTSSCDRINQDRLEVGRSVGRFEISSIRVSDYHLARYLILLFGFVWTSNSMFVMTTYLTKLVMARNLSHM